jgi:hypothetical protein
MPKPTDIQTAASQIYLDTWTGRVAWLAALAPQYGIVPRAVQKAFDMGLVEGATADAMTYGPMLSITPLLLAGSMPSLFQTKPKAKTFVAGGMTFTEKDLYTNLLITGTIGSGKTSAVLLPMLEQILMTYNQESDDDINTGKYAKAGGLMVDVKGQFYEYVIAMLYRAGRTVVEDLIVLTPISDFAVVEFTEPSTGHHFYLSARNCSSGSEASRLLSQHRMPTGERIPSDIFEWPSKERKEAEEHLKTITFRVPDDCRFCGWREVDGRLARVSHTTQDGTPAFILSPEHGNSPITVSKPRELRYNRVIFVNNGVRTNLLNPSLPSGEVANRQSVIAAMASGGSGGNGENQYFYDQASIVMSWSIELWRALYPDKEVTVVDVLKLVTQQSYLAEQLKKLTVAITKLTRELEGKSEDESRIDMRQLQKLKDIGLYFQDTWGTRDAKNKGLIASTVEVAFKAFLGDSNLQEVFCQPSTFKWTDTLQKGKIIVLHAGEKYESLGKQLGTGAKFDYQSAILSRLQLAHLNKERFCFYVADEGHNFATAGGASGGDDKFMSLAREACCFNMVATQSLSSLFQVIGEKNANVYMQCFGGICALQTMDPVSAKRTSELIGRIRRERSERSGSDLTLGSMLVGKGNVSTSTRTEKEAWFEPEFFHSLDVFESVTFNKGRTGRYDKVKRFKNKPSWITGPSGKKEVAEYMRRYFQEAIEQFLFRQNKTAWLNHCSTPLEAPTEAKQSAVTKAEPTAPPLKETPAPASPTAPITKAVTPPEPPPPPKPPPPPEPMLAEIKPQNEPVPSEAPRATAKEEAKASVQPEEKIDWNERLTACEEAVLQPEEIWNRLAEGFASVQIGETADELMDPSFFLDEASKKAAAEAESEGTTGGRSAPKEAGIAGPEGKKVGQDAGEITRTEKSAPVSEEQAGTKRVIRAKRTDGAIRRERARKAEEAIAQPPLKLSEENMAKLQAFRERFQGGA